MTPTLTEQSWSLPGGFRIVRYSGENTLELRTRNERAIGYMAWRSADDRVGVKYRTIEIEQLQIDERFQSRGLGEAMLRRFIDLAPELYPHAKYVVARTATSQGIINLMRKVFGPEIRTRNVEKLPLRSPEDWLRTLNRGYALFKLPAQKTAQEVVERLLEADADDFTDPKAELHRLTPVREIRLRGNDMLSAYNIIRLAQQQFKSQSAKDRQWSVKVLSTGWPGIPDDMVQAVLKGSAEVIQDGDDAIIKVRYANIQKPDKTNG
jgi:ribosomal protein S18 acetylase RimI-like enzyme